MSVDPSQRRNGSWRSFVQPLLAMVVAYAVCIGAFVAATSGLHAIAASSDPGQAFELCRNGAPETPASPADPRDDLCHLHCVLIAGEWQHWLGAPPPAEPERIHAAIAVLGPLAGSRNFGPRDGVGLAQPRAPPSNA